MSAATAARLGRLPRALARRSLQALRLSPACCAPACCAVQLPEPAEAAPAANELFFTEGPEELRQARLQASPCLPRAH